MPKGRSWLGAWWSVLLVLTEATSGLGAEPKPCPDILLTPQLPAYHIYADQTATCPGSGVHIRCHHYHWDWICTRADTLFWDRRLEAAAAAACGCAPPAGVAPASPAVSGPPARNLIHSNGQTVSPKP